MTASTSTTSVHTHTALLGATTAGMCSKSCPTMAATALTSVCCSRGSMKTIDLGPMPETRTVEVVVLASDMVMA